MSNLNDLLGDSLATLGLKQAQKQTLGAMKMQAPAQTRPAPVGMAPMSPAPMFPGTPGPTPAMPRNDFDPFAPMPSPQTGMRPPMAAPPPKAVPHAGSASGNLDDLLGNMDLGARQRDSASNLMGMSQQQPKPQNGLDALDSFFGAPRPAAPQAAAAPASAGDPFAALGRPPSAAAAPATPAPAPSGGLDAFDFFSGSGAAAPPPSPKPAPVAPPPQAAAPASAARPASSDDFDLFTRGGGAQPAPPQPSAAPKPPPPPVAPPSPTPASAAPDFDFFSGGAPGAASAPPATPAAHQPSFDDLDSLGNIGGSAMKKAVSHDPLDNIMGWGSAPAQASHVQSVVAPRAAGAQPDLFGVHVSAAQVAAVQQATAADLFDDEEGPVDPNEPEERRQLRLKRIEAKKARVAEKLREKLELDAKQAAELEEKHQLADVVGVRLEAWQKMGKGNIRAYLTTDVLWEGNTWKPITLMDLVSTDQVRKAWNKVLINIHPDKVQQKGGTVAQRYVADKVFHVMLDAYNLFKQKEGLS